MGVPIVTHLANSAMLRWRTPPISYPYVLCWKQNAKSYSATPHLSSRTWIYQILHVTWLCMQMSCSDITFQAFCINFLAELKALRAELIAQT